MIQALTELACELLLSLPMLVQYLVKGSSNWLIIKQATSHITIKCKSKSKH